MKNPGKENLDEYIKWLRSELKEAEAQKQKEMELLTIEKTKADSLIRQRFDSYTVKDIDNFRCDENLKTELLEDYLANAYARERQHEERWKEKNYALLKAIDRILNTMQSGTISLYKIPASRRLFDDRYVFISDDELTDIKKTNKSLQEFVFSL